MTKINIAELLKDCPKGMELDCTMYDNLYFNCIREHPIYPITCWTVDSKGNRHDISFNWYGKSSSVDTAKCVIFPKGKTTWEGFQPPFKDGDVIADKYGNIAIYKGENMYDKDFVDFYCRYRKTNKTFLMKEDTYEHFGLISEMRYASKEEKQKLFDAIKANGYKWNAETKTLEKLPKFKVGDKIRLKEHHNYIYPITGIKEEENKYECGVTFVLSFSKQDEWELIPNKFDITTLKPFESKVLVRSECDITWRPALFGCYIKEHYDSFYVVGGNSWRYCIPYDGNEHLLGKTDDCDDFYKTWKE